ncbi:MAG: hypothetical protein ACLUJG_07165 [Lawsonibacter sp.]
MNSLLEFLERQELQWYTKSDWREAETAALTRKEYIQLLQEAKRQENITLYLLVKTFALAGLSVQHLNDLTWEAVNRGAICTERKRYCQVVTLPDGLRQELWSTPFGTLSVPAQFSRGRREAVEPHDRHISDLTSGQGRGAGARKSQPTESQRPLSEYPCRLSASGRRVDEKRYAKLLEKEEAQAGWLAERR